jgi:hypothetical protein
VAVSRVQFPRCTPGYKHDKTLCIGRFGTVLIKGMLEVGRVTVLAHLVFANFRPAHKGTQHRSHTQFVNTISYFQTIPTDWNGDLPGENTKE